MNHMRSQLTLITAFTIALSVCLTQSALAEVDPNDPEAIMKAVQAQESGDKSKSSLTIRIVDGGGAERVRQVKSFAMDFADAQGVKGTKQIMYFLEPEDIRGTGLLSVDYDDGSRDDDQWLYLPSLAKSTRISSGDKSGSFMGTDLSYADMTQADPAHYTYEMKKPSVKLKVDGKAEECWLIKSTPKTEKAKSETGYTHSYVWVSKEKMMPLKIIASIRKGRRIKQILFRGVKRVNGFWTAHQIVATTKRRGQKQFESETTLTFSEMSYNNASVTGALFTQSRLRQGF